MAETMPVRKVIFDLEKFAMFAPTPGVEGRRARFIWGIRESNPRLTVFTGDPKDVGAAGILTAPMDPTTFFMFLTQLEAAARSQGPTNATITNLTSRRDESGRQTPKTPLSDLKFGKDEKGMVYIAITVTNRPEIRFYFDIYEYHLFYKADGSAMGAAEGSALSALATITALRGIYTNLITKGLEDLGATKAAERANKSQGMPAQRPKVVSAGAEFEDISF